MDRLKMMETFVRVAKASSLTQAAGHLGMSRALVSKHIQNLEAHLGVRLFNRTTRHVAITEIGQEYYGFCVRVLAEITEEERSLAFLQSQPRGSLKVFSPMGYGNLRLATVVAAFMKRYPDISVNVVLGDLTMTPVEMIEGGFDIAIQTGVVADMSLPGRKAEDVPWIACATSDYLKVHGAPEVPADLVHHNCLVHRKISPDSIWTFSDEAEEKVRVSGTLMTNSVLIMREAVRNDQGIAILPAYCVADELKRGEFIEVLPDYSVRSRPVYILLAYERFMPSKVRAFVDFLVQSSSDVLTVKSV